MYTTRLQIYGRIYPYSVKMLSQWRFCPLGTNSESRECRKLTILWLIISVAGILANAGCNCHQHQCLHLHLQIETVDLPE